MILCLFVIFYVLVERAMSPAQSEDSGLATDRGTTYATISLPRDNVNAMGIVFAGKYLYIICMYFELLTYYLSRKISKKICFLINYFIVYIIFTKYANTLLMNYSKGWKIKKFNYIILKIFFY